MDDSTTSPPVSPPTFLPTPDLRVTRTFHKFAREYGEDVDFFFYVIGLSARIDETVSIAARALAKGGTEKDAARLAELEADPDPAQKRLNEFSRVLSRNLVNATVSGVQQYFSDILKAVMLAHPEMLSTRESIKVEDALRLSKHEDLVAFLIDRKLHELSYGGLRDLESYLSERLAVPLFANDDARALLSVFVELRNINVHNGGVVDRVFLTRVGGVAGFTFKLGKRFHVDFELFERLAANALRVTEALDSRIAAKFELPQQTIREWRNASKA